MEQCPICHGDIQYNNFGGSSEVICPRCTTFKVASSAFAILRGAELTDRQRSNISGWLRENSGTVIYPDNIEKLSQIRTPSFHEMADKLLLSIEKLGSYAGEILLIDATWFSMSWAVNEKEFLEIIGFLTSTNRLISDASTNLDERYVRIAPEGWAHLESIRSVNAQSTQGFVAMWFHDDMQNIYDHAIALGIQNAGYKPHRVDQREHNDKIDDEIISQIRSSRFVLADFTGHRGGVYFEAGYAKGLGLEVIWTCRDDDVNELHFDIRQYNCIFWNEGKLEEFSNKIKYRIEAIIGHGSYI